MTATLEAHDCRLDPPLRTARDTISSRHVLLFRVDDGPGGVGESAPLVPFTETYEESHRALRRAVTAYKKSGWPGAFRVVSRTTDGMVRFPAARHAVSLALFDVRAKKRGEPLYTLLGGRTGSSISVNATVGDGSPAETAQEADRAVRDGFRAIKIKVGVRSIADDVERVRAVRDRIGPAPEVRVDANGAWDLDEATTFLEQTADLGVSILEQPLSVEATSAHDRLRGYETEILLDESLAHEPIDSLLAADVADGYVLKPMAVGGVDRARAIALRAQRNDATVVLTSIFESLVGRTGAIHLAASLERLPPSGLATANRFVSDLGPDPAPVRNGSIVPPTAPGLGLEEALE